jgi:di/tricarboxylate transporter
VGPNPPRPLAPGEASEAAIDEQPRPSRPYQLLTVAGILTLAGLTLFFELDIGFVAITIGLVLTLIAPQLQKRAVGQVPWPEILLITGVGTYVGVLDEMGTIDYVGESVADLASPLLVALLLCFIAAMAVSSTIVDVSPFSCSPRWCSGSCWWWSEVGAELSP